MAKGRRQKNIPQLRLRDVQGTLLRDERCSRLDLIGRSLPRLGYAVQDSHIKTMEMAYDSLVHLVWQPCGATLGMFPITSPPSALPGDLPGLLLRRELLEGCLPSSSMYADWTVLGALGWSSSRTWGMALITIEGCRASSPPEGLSPADLPARFQQRDRLIRKKLAGGDLKPLHPALPACGAKAQHVATIAEPALPGGQRRPPAGRGCHTPQVGSQPRWRARSSVQPWQRLLRCSPPGPAGCRWCSSI